VRPLSLQVSRSSPPAASPASPTGISINSLAPSVGTLVALAKLTCAFGMVTTRSEALRGPWGDRMKERPQGGESSSRPSPTLEILNERIAQMEKEMYELEKKNAELQRHHAEDSNSANPQPVGGEEQDEEMQPSSREGRRERKKNQNVVDQKPRKNRTSKRMDKKLKEIIEKLEQRCDLLTEAA
jgi:Spy/CpxP family protein refolding chaperone